MDIDATLNRSLESSSNQLQLARSQLEQESHCLSSCIGRLRNQLRQLAFDDLAPILSRLNFSNQHSTSFSSSISTRNLAGESLLGQESLLVVKQTQLEQQTNNDSHLIAYVSPHATQSDAAEDASTGAGLKVKLMRVYKETAGKALVVVVASGFLVFLINLLIVLLSALRNSSRSRDQRADADNKQSEQPQLEAKKKSTLKKNSKLCDPHQSAGFEQLFECANQTNRSKKRLKFDLSGVRPANELDMELQPMESCCNQQQATSNELYGRPELVQSGSCQHLALDVVPMLNGTNLNWAQPELHLCQAEQINQQQQHQFCSLSLSSPFTSTSSEQRLGPPRHLLEAASGSQHLAMLANNSPESSATTMTPNQLESFANVPSPQQFQLEPIGLIYETSSKVCNHLLGLQQLNNQEMYYNEEQSFHNH